MTGLTGLVAIELLAMTATIASCSDPFVGCEPSRPAVLPDGSIAETVAEKTYRGRQPEFVWGDGPAEVRIVGFRAQDDSPVITFATPGVSVRGVPARVNDQTDSTPALEWRTNGCEFHAWLDPTLTRVEVIAYAGRY